MHLLFLLMVTIHSQAQVFEGPVSSALGGSGRAGLDAGEGALLDPALAGFLSKSEAAGYYQDGYIDGEAHRQAVGATLTENNDDVLFAGELGYFRTRDTGILPQASNGEIWEAAIGKLFFKNQLAIGISAYRYGITPVGQPEMDQWNGAVGAVYRLLPNLGIAYVFENPVNASSSVPEQVRLEPQQSVGVFYKTPYHAQLRLDVLRWEQDNPGQRLNVHTSVESDLNDYWLFRLGGRWDEIQDETYVTAGIAFNGPTLKIDYSFQKNVLRTGGAVHSVDMRMSF